MMDKDAIEKIIQLAEPNFKEVDGFLLSDKAMKVVPLPAPDMVHTHTLRGLINILKQEFVTDYSLFVHVVDPTHVSVFGTLREDHSREIFYKAEAMLPEVKFGTFMPVEEMIVMLRSRFVLNKDAELLLQGIGNLRSFNAKKTTDDGVSQKIEVSAGIDTGMELVIEPIRKLKPYRTFTEVEQPEGEFLFRMRDDGRGVTCALFEADGGDWRVKAADILTKFLTEELKELEGVTVIQ